MGELQRAETRIAELRRALDRPVDVFSREALIAFGLGVRAANLYDGAIAIAEVSPTGSAVVIRSLSELAIVMRWLEVDPPLRQRLWLAEDHRVRIADGKRWQELRRRRGFDAPEVFHADEIRMMNREIDAARSAAVAARRRRPNDKSKSLLPSLEVMSQAGPEGWEIYEIAYRTLSAYVHTSGRAFVGDGLEPRADGTYLVPGSAWSPEELRSLAAPSLCVALASGSRVAGLGIDSECDAIRLALAAWSLTDEEPAEGSP